MMKDRQLHIGLALAATWRKGRDPSEDDTPSSLHDAWDFHVGLAQMAEKARLDFVFKPDYLVLHPALVGRSPSSVNLDPTMMFASIARSTEKIGMVTTASTTFNSPYIVARQMQSLHWISNGRAGWNIVTSIEGAENFGDAPMPSSDERYRKAAEFTDVVRKLWRSHPYEVMTEGAGYAPIDHVGEFFSVKGPLNIAGHPAGPPPLFQAGASDSGRTFAASVADAIFGSIPDMQAGIELRADLRARAEGHGRDSGAVRVLPGLYFFIAKTREEAWRLHRQAHAHLTRDKRDEALKTVLGLDVRGMPLDTRITPDLLPARDQFVRSRTHADLLRRFIESHHPTLDKLLARPEVVGSAHWVSVGTVEDVLGEIVGWFEAGAMDGFIALPGGSFESLQLFLTELVPALVARGLFRRDYQGSTLREHLGIR